MPDYLSAESPQGLRRLMRLNNFKRGCWHKYDILFVNGKWVAWYYPAVSTPQEQAQSVKEVGEVIKAGE